MTGSDIQGLLDDSPCVTGQTKGQLDWLRVILLWKIVNGDVPMTAEDIQELLDESACVANLTDGQLQWIQTILLFNISNGGGNALREVYQDTGNPNDLGLIPGAPSRPAYYENLEDNSEWWWHVDDQSWINPADSGYFPENFTQGFYYVPTFNDIRLLASYSYNKFAIAQGQLADDDEQGAMFRWDPNSAEADDGIDILEPSDGGIAGFGRWKRY